MVFLDIGIIGILIIVAILVIGILILVLVVGTLIAFLPATLVAILVWLLTGDFFWAVIAFLVVALFMVVFRR